MEIKDRSVIFKAEELNIVDVATGGQVAESLIQMASDIIFHHDKGYQDPVIRLTEPQDPSLRVEAHLIRGSLGSRITL